MLRLILAKIVLMATIVMAQELPFHNYSTVNGLTQSQVAKLHQDKLGYLWFSTYNGVDRYDGVAFTHFEFYEQLVRTMYEDSRGFIWFASSTAGLFFLPVQNPVDSLLKNINTNDGLNSNLIMALVEDRHHNLWVATLNQGFNYLRFEADSLVSIDSIHITEMNNDKQVLCLSEDSKGRIWCGYTEGLSIFQWQTNHELTVRNLSSREGLPQVRIYDIQQTPDSTIWCVTSDGVYCSDLENIYFHPLNVLDSSAMNIETRVLQFDSQGKLWLGTNGNGIYRGTYQAQKKGWKFENFTTMNGLVGDRVYTILEDREKNLWFGTWGNGVSKLIHNGFINYRMALGQPLKNIYGLYQDHLEDIWIGTDGRGILRLTNGKYTQYDSENGLGSNSVWYISGDREDNIWLCTLNGLKCFHPRINCFTHLTEADGLAGNNVLSVYEDRFGHFWVGHLNTGVTLFQHNPASANKKQSAHFRHLFPGHAVYCFHESKSGAIWVGSVNGAFRLSTIEESIDQLADYDLKLLDNISVWCIYEDRWERIWFGTNGNGLICFNGDSLIQLTKKNGLCDNTIYFIQPDSSNHLWLGTNRGINRVQIELDSLKVCQHFDTRDGLASNETNVNCSILDQKQQLWFGTVAGVSQYLLEKESANSIPPLIYIKGLKHFDQPIPLKESLKLNHKQNNLTFSYLGLSFKNELGIKYQYKLMGFDQAWSEITAQREVQYTKLDPGKYCFQVKAVNSDGMWSKLASLRFFIAPPWWLSWWARTLSFIILVMVVFLLYELRVRHVKKLNRRLEMKAQQKTNELTASERRYRTLIESSDDFIFTVNSQGHYTTLNKTFCDRFQIKQKELIGKGELEFLPTDTSVLMQQKIQQALQGEIVTFNLNFIHPQLGVFEIETTLSPLREDSGLICGVVGIGRDVSERIRMQYEIKSERDKLSTILEVMDDMVMIINGESKIIYINRAFKKTFPNINIGPSSDELVQTVLKKYKPSKKFVKGALAEPPQAWEYEDKRRKLFLSGISCAIKLPEGACQVFILRDITERRKLEKERLNAERLAAVTQTAIAYNHEINNPLFGIIGYLEIMMQNETDPNRYEELSLIYDAANRIAEVTKRLKRLTRPAIREYVGSVKMLDVAASTQGDI